MDEVKNKYLDIGSILEKINMLYLQKGSNTYQNSIMNKRIYGHWEPYYLNYASQTKHL